MNHKLPRPIIAIVVLGAIAILYFGLANLNNDGNGELKASGSIEATIVNISPELAGKILEVQVYEGTRVKANDPLFSLDASLLTAQRSVASAQVDTAKAALQSAQNALATAKSQYQIVLEAALAQEKSTRLKDWFSDPDVFQQPGWYYTRDEEIQAAQTQVDVALAAVTEAESNLAALTQSIDQGEFQKAEKRLLDARLAYLITQNVNYHAQNSATADLPNGFFNRTHCGTNQGYFVDSAKKTNSIYKCTRDPQLGDAGGTLYNDALAELTSAQNAYNDLLKTQSTDSILKARAEIAVARERYYTALDFLRTLQTGEQSPNVTAALGVVDQAQSAVDQATKAVIQAQANLDLIDAQKAKLAAYAPIDGVVLTRNVEPGEFVQPGAVALTMADINDLTITVYVPENLYGQIKLGLTAEVSVDSFPREVFTATVVNISDQAEFTPRNVQTVEGRSSTFYAIKLKVDDPQGRLKIGMPADVIFSKQ